MRQKSIPFTLGSAALFLLTVIPSSAQTQSPTDVVRGVVEVEKHLPWFWTPSPDGIRDVPYAYEYEMHKRKLNSNGREEFPPKDAAGHYKQVRNLHLEHIPLKSGWGFETRCISQDGTACGKNANFDTPPERDPEKFRQARDKRREQRIALWNEFLRAFHFELQGPDHIHFIRTGTYEHARVDDANLFEKIEGDFWFDRSTHEIYKMEFELAEDAGNLIGKLYKGSQFSIELTRAIDDRYLPSKWSVHMNQRMLTSKGAEESEVRYFNYRKFGSAVTLSFGDLDVPGKD